MDLKERLMKILRDELGINSDEQLEEAYEQIDTSVYGIFTEQREEAKSA